jgi:hypothetical protein
MACRRSPGREKEAGGRLALPALGCSVTAIAQSPKIRKKLAFKKLPKEVTCVLNHRIGVSRVHHKLSSATTESPSRDLVVQHPAQTVHQGLNVAWLEQGAALRCLDQFRERAMSRLHDRNPRPPSPPVRTTLWVREIPWEHKTHRCGTGIRVSPCRSIEPR